MILYCIRFCIFLAWILQVGAWNEIFFPPQIHPGWWHAILSFSICGCVCVCPFLGQVSLNTSPKHRAQGKHFHVKPRNPSPPLPSHVNTESHPSNVFPWWFKRSKRRSSLLSCVPLLSLCPGDFLSEASLSPLIPARKISTRTSWATEVISAFTGLTICCLKCHHCYCKTAGLSD